MEQIFKMPEDELARFKSFIELPDSEFIKVAEVVDSIPFGLDFNDADDILSKVTPASDLILNLFITNVHHNLSLEEFSSILYESFLQKKDLNLSISKDQFWQRISKIFNNSSPLRITAKAKSLRSQVQNYYSGKKILSDVRPIFSDKNSEEINAFLITHTLKIEYFFKDGENPQDFFVSLSRKDISELKEALDRAEKKHIAIENALNLTNLPFLS